MGLLTSVVVMLALIIDLTLLPPLLMKFAGNSHVNKKQEIN
jgi:predicted RND superfamily exporter protein